MSNRSAYPDSAFAYIGKLAGATFKLLRHHTTDVKDGNEHDTVNPVLLAACLQMVDQMPVSKEEKEKARAHLNTHAQTLNIEPKTDDAAKRSNNICDGGDPYQGMKDLTRSGEASLPPQPDLSPPVADKDSKSDKVQAAVSQDDELVPCPNQDGAKSDNPSYGGGGGAGEPTTSDKPSTGGGAGPDGSVVLDEDEKLVSNPNTEKFGKAEAAKAEVSDESKKKVNSAKRSVKSENDLPDSSFAVIEKGGEKDASGKTVPRSYRHLPYKDASGKIDLPHLRNALARMNQIQAKSPKDSTERIRAAARKVLVAAAKKALPNTQFAKQSVNDEQFNAETAVTEIDNLVEAAKKRKKAKKSNKTMKFGYAECLDAIKRAMEGKIIAKIHSVEKAGSTEMMNVQMGDNKDYPMTVMMDVMRNGSGEVMAVKILNQHLPGEILADLGKFLSGLSKEAYKPEEKTAAKVELTTAPAKLESCKHDLLARKVADYTKKNGHPPDEKTRKKMESSAYAICTASLKKSGQM